MRSFLKASVKPLELISQEVQEVIHKEEAEEMADLVLSEATLTEIDLEVVSKVESRVPFLEESETSALTKDR